MTLLLDDDAVIASIDITGLIADLETAFRAEADGGVVAPPRVNLAADTEFFRLMPVVSTDLDIMGFKAFNGSVRRGVRYLVALYRASTGELLALMDAAHLTAARTGATSAIAARRLTPEGRSWEVGVIGSGLEAETNLEAICSVRRVESARVFSPKEDNRRGFAERMQARLDVPVTAVESPGEAAEAPIVIAATNTGIDSGVVALRGEWLSEESFVATIGSTMPSLREADVATFADAAVLVVDTLQAREESGDLRALEAAGANGAVRMRTLTELLIDGFEPARATRARRVFKSVGTATQDVVAASAVYRRALDVGRGTKLDFVQPKRF